eukprot:124732_1
MATLLLIMCITNTWSLNNETNQFNTTTQFTSTQFVTTQWNLSCPDATHQIGEINSKVKDGGCGMCDWSDCCSHRYETYYPTIKDCADECESEGNCKLFSWIPIGGSSDKRLTNHSICTLYNQGAEIHIVSDELKSYEILCQPNNYNYYLWLYSRSWISTAIIFVPYCILIWIVRKYLYIKLKLKLKGVKCKATIAGKRTELRGGKRKRTVYFWRVQYVLLYYDKNEYEHCARYEYDVQVDGQSYNTHDTNSCVDIIYCVSFSKNKDIQYHNHHIWEHDLNDKCCNIVSWIPGSVCVIMIVMGTTWPIYWLAGSLVYNGEIVGIIFFIMNALLVVPFLRYCFCPFSLSLLCCEFKQWLTDPFWTKNSRKDVVITTEEYDEFLTDLSKQQNEQDIEMAEIRQKKVERDAIINRSHFLDIFWINYYRYCYLLLLFITATLTLVIFVIMMIRYAMIYNRSNTVLLVIFLIAISCPALQLIVLIFGDVYFKLTTTRWYTCLCLIFSAVLKSIFISAFMLGGGPFLVAYSNIKYFYPQMDITVAMTEFYHENLKGNIIKNYKQLKYTIITLNYLFIADKQYKYSDLIHYLNNKYRNGELHTISFKYIRKLSSDNWKQNYSFLSFVTYCVGNEHTSLRTATEPIYFCGGFLLHLLPLAYFGILDNAYNYEIILFSIWLVLQIVSLFLTLYYVLPIWYCILHYIPFLSNKKASEHDLKIAVKSNKLYFDEVYNALYWNDKNVYPIIEQYVTPRGVAQLIISFLRAKNLSDILNIDMPTPFVE